MAILKNVGKGILYIIALPFFLIVLALTAVMGLFLLIFMFFKSIILFFTGRSLDDDLPEDIQVKELRNGRNVPPTTEPVQDSQDELIVQPYVAPANNTTIEEAVFGHPTYESPTNEEPVVEEPPVEDSFVEEPEDDTPTTPDVPNQEEPLSSIDINDSPVQSDVTEIDIGQYVPHTGGSRFIDEEDEEEDDSGVTISYGDEDD